MLTTGSSKVTKTQPLPDVKAFVDNIFDQYRYAEVTLATKLGQLNLQNHLRLHDWINGVETEEPVEPHTRVMGFNSVVTFDEPGGQVYVPIPSHHADDWSPNNSSRITKQLESSAPWQVQLEAPFKCSLCRKIVTFRGQEAWMIHVYADLKAYVCIHPECDQSYEYFHLWADHVSTNHFPNLKRYCVYCNAEILTAPDMSSRNAFIKHLVEKHWHKLSDSNRTTATLCTERFVYAPFKSPCGICGRASGKTWYDFAAHVARHLEEISLAALSDNPYPLIPVKNTSRKRTEKLRSRSSRSNLQNNPLERGESVRPRRDEKQVESLEEEYSDSDESNLEDQDYVKVEREVQDSPLPTIRKPHRASLRLRKVRDNGKFREDKGEQSDRIESTATGNITMTGDDDDDDVQARYKGRERRRSYQRRDESPSNNKSARRQQKSKQYPDEDTRPNQAVDSPSPFYLPYTSPYERQNVAVQGYENYMFTIPSQNYYAANYSYSGGAYDNRYAYHSPLNEQHAYSGTTAQCKCPTCTMAEEYV